jgi:hypothetical protein
MKKFTLIFIILLAMAGITRAQVIEDFESIKMNLMAGGADDLSSFTVVANPDTAGPANINKSAMVCKFLRDKDGVPWGGFYAPVTTPIDMTTNKYVHLKVWKPRISPVHCKLEDGPTPTEIQPINAQSVVGGWEELVFDFSAITGVYNKLTFMPDFNDPVGLTEDITIYFDHFYVNNDPTVGSAPIQVIEDYEHIPLNYLLGGAEDQSSMTQIPNPDPSGINVTTNVIKFVRDKDGVPWGGFWSPLPTPVDVTVNKYVHVKLWKPRISGVKFKLEGGAAGTLEIASMNAQTLTNTWEDFVFDFSGKTGTYPIIALLADVVDPVGLTEDITIYFDDILVSDDPTPIAPTVKTINVDMHGSGLTAGQQVFISGDFGGAYGTWAQPGTIAGNEMFDADGDSIYSITIVVADGLYHFKFFKGANWDNGDNGPGDRALNIKGNLDITYKWGVKATTITLNVDMHGSGLTLGQPVYVAGAFGGNYGTWDQPGTNLNNMMKDADGDSIYTVVLSLGQIGTYPFKFFKGNGWDGGEWAGDPNRSLKIVIGGDTTATYIWGQKPEGIGENPLAGKVRAYPVPFSNILNINTLVDVKTVVISTSYGQQVARLENLEVGRTTINTSDLACGMYFITFYGKNGGQFTQKLIK